MFEIRFKLCYVKILKFNHVLCKRIYNWKLQWWTDINFLSSNPERGSVALWSKTKTYESQCLSLAKCKNFVCLLAKGSWFSPCTSVFSTILELTPEQKWKNLDWVLSITIPLLNPVVQQLTLIYHPWLSHIYI